MVLLKRILSFAEAAADCASVGLCDHVPILKMPKEALTWGQHFHAMWALVLLLLWLLALVLLLLLLNLEGQQWRTGWCGGGSGRCWPAWKTRKRPRSVTPSTRLPFYHHRHHPSPSDHFYGCLPFWCPPITASMPHRRTSGLLWGPEYKPVQVPSMAIILTNW